VINDDEYLAVNNVTAKSYMEDVFRTANIEHLQIKNLSTESLESQTDTFCVLSPKTIIIDNIKVHAALIQVILKYELDVSRMPHYKWNENFSVTAKKILKVHSDYRLLEDSSVLFAKWIAYIETHQQHPLSLEIFHIILDNVICQSTKKKRNKSFKIKLPGQIKIYPGAIARVIKVGTVKKGIPDPINNNYIHLKAKTDVVKFFWKSAYKLFDNFLSFIHDLHYDDLNSSDVLDKGQALKKMCIIIGKFENIEIPDDYEERNFKECVKETLIYGTKEHFKQNVNHNVLEDPNLSTRKMDELIIILKFVQRHLKKFDEAFGLVFEL
jgi:hypothetical protein